MISTQTAMAGSYDYSEVARSILIAVAASYAALDLAGRMTAARDSARAAWLTSGAIAMGIGIWAMHFKGMLAFRLPVTVGYHWPTVLVSLVIAVLASAITLYVATRQKMGPVQAWTGSCIIGGGIAAMHYVGMAAMRLAAVTRFNPLLVALSVVLAILFSRMALMFTFDYREDFRGTTLSKVISAAVMGGAISVMHYTGMAAASFMPAAAFPNLSHVVSISPLANNGIAIVTFLVLGTAIWTSSVDRRFHAQTLGQAEANYRSLVERTPVGILRSSPDGRLLVVNRALVHMLGYDSESELLKANLNTDIYVNPAERARNIELFSETDQIVLSEVEWKRKDGSRIRVRGNGQVIRDKT